MSGRLKILICNVREATNILSIRASALGDPEYWRERYEGERKENEIAKVKIDALEDAVKRYRSKRSEFDIPSSVSRLIIQRGWGHYFLNDL
jgi:hypothetical protein